MATANGTSTKVKSPSHMAHVVLRTKDRTRLRDWYLALLGASISAESPGIVLLRYDDEHHRLAIIGDPELDDINYKQSGLEHIAFTYDSIKDLCDAYKQRKELGITPAYCVNHGITTSMYYCDPDGNNIEMQVDNCDPDTANEIMKTDLFAQNPLGADFDPEWLCGQIDAGVSEDELKKPVDVGPRGLDDLREVMGKMHRPSKPVAIA